MASYRLFQTGQAGQGGSVTNGPASATGYTGTFISGVCFMATEGNCWFEGFWWWCASSGQSTAAVKCALWSATNGTDGSGGATPAQAVVPGSVVTSGTLTTGAWNWVPLAEPVQLSPFGTYVAAVGCNGAFPDTAAFYASGPVTNGPLYAFGEGTTLGGTSYWHDGTGNPDGIPNGCFASSGSADPSLNFPGSSSATDNFWVDVQVADATPAAYSGSFRLYPNRQGADSMTSLDAAEPYVVGTEFDLAQTCAIDNIWCYSNLNAPHLPAAADIWQIGSPATGGTNLLHIASPSWENAAGAAATAGQGWIKQPVTGLTLPPGKYKVSVYDQNGGVGSGVSKRLSYWGLDTNSGDGYVANSACGTNGFAMGPLTFPSPSSGASLAFSYDNGSADGINGLNYNNATEAGQSTFAVGDGTASTATGDIYPNQYVGAHSSGGDLFQNYWVDVEVTPVPIGTVTIGEGPETVTAAGGAEQIGTAAVGEGPETATVAGVVSGNIDSPATCVITVKPGPPLEAGVVVDFIAAFADEDGNPVDPTTVVVSYEWGPYLTAMSVPTQVPYAGSQTASINQVGRTGTGVYVLRVDTTGEPGYWWVEAVGTGAGQATGSALVHVEPPPF